MCCSTDYDVVQRILLCKTMAHHHELFTHFFFSYIPLPSTQWIHFETHIKCNDNFNDSKTLSSCCLFSPSILLKSQLQINLKPNQRLISIKLKCHAIECQCSHNMKHDDDKVIWQSLLSMVRGCLVSMPKILVRIHLRITISSTFQSIWSVVVSLPFKLCFELKQNTGNLTESFRHRHRAEGEKWEILLELQF